MIRAVFIQYKKSIWIKTFMLILIQLKFVLCIVKKLLSKICLRFNANNSYNSSERIEFALYYKCIAYVLFFTCWTVNFK